MYLSMALVRPLATIRTQAIRIANNITGSQSHLSSSSGTAVALKSLAAVAPEVAITELDIAGASAADYEAVTKACLDLDNCVGITAWGVSDAQSWRPGENPLLFDGSFKPKAAYTALVSSLQ